jgi:putative copper export protein
MNEGLFAWRDVFFQCVGFVSSFLILGPVGFRYGVVPLDSADADAAPPLVRAVARAAAMGVLGAALGAISIVASLHKRAEAKHLTLEEAASAAGTTLVIQVVLLAVVLLAFVLAWRRVAQAWLVAAVASAAYALRGIADGRLAAMVNPLHVLGASLWLGTLLVLVVCGLGELLRPTVATPARERAVADMVHRFSVVGLSGSALLGITGLVTAWTHLKRLDALWTTPYGLALDRKLVVVLAVVALGAWNWRKVGPSLGTEGGALKIRRTAATELAVAAVVLVLTGILVSTPSPK